MRQRLLGSLFVLLASCAEDERETGIPAIYDTCFVLSDCVEGATRCEELAVEFAGLEYANAICTTECSVAGTLSPDCARAPVGRPGSCYPGSVAGGIDSLICLEPCESDQDCLLGFRCLTATDLCGRATNCPIDDTDAICVPGPN